MKINLYKIAIICCLSMICESGLAQIKVLFDASQAESAANADWIIDADLYNVGFGTGVATIGGSGTEANPARFPTPAQNTITSATTETYWKGGLSAWGIECVKKGYSVETLPVTGKITYNDATNVQDLSNYKIFIVCEPNIALTALERTAILAFVQNGGGLMMIADHDGSDRNFDGIDSPSIWNQLMATNNPFGMTFDLLNFSQTTSNITTASNPLSVGSYGTVTKVQFSGGTTLTLNPTANSTVKGIVYKTGGSGNTNVMVATAIYGAGRVVAMGDSSPADDGTGDTGDTLYDGWIEDAGGTGNHRKLLMNATEWLAAGTVVTPVVAAITNKKNVTCFGLTDGTATAMATGGTPPYTYKWSNGATTATISNLVAGTYTITVTGGTISTASTVIASPSAISITINNATINCNFPTVTLTPTVSGGTPTYTYKWSNNATDKNIIILKSGPYTVTVTDNQGCSKLQITNVIGDTIKPKVSIAYSNPNCTTLCAEAKTSNPQGVLSYLWADGSALAKACYGISGTRKVIVTGQNLCTTAVDVAFVLDLLAVQSSNITMSTNGLKNGAATATATGGVKPYSYEWKNNLGTVIATTATLTGVIAGTYSCKTTDANQCEKTITVVISNVTATTDFNALQLSIAPNPAIDNFHISLFTNNIELQVFDNQGINKMNKTLTIENDINVSDWNTGVYFFYFYDKSNGNHAVKKVSIQTK
jgi:hypothetical protein